MPDQYNMSMQYDNIPFAFADAPSDPVDLFETFFNLARAHSALEPNAMAIATVEGNKPHVRYVLMKHYDARGIVFFTNYNSAKARQLEENNALAASFWWPSIERQVRIEGRAYKIDAKDSDAYFDQRKVLSNIAASVSLQSQPLDSRETLKHAFEEKLQAYQDAGTLERPAHWGGYVLEPSYWEFWVGQRNRMHDRIAYQKTDTAWEKTRLWP